MSTCGGNPRRQSVHPSYACPERRVLHREHRLNRRAGRGLPLAPYAVTKHAVVALSESLHLALERRRAPVKVSVLCPGAVRTNILDSERNRPVGLRNETVEITPEMQAFADFMKAQIDAGMSPLQVADHVFKAIEEERFYILTHPELMPMIQLRMDSIMGGDNPRGLDSAEGKRPLTAGREGYE